MTKQEFDKYWDDNYKKISYEDVKEAFEEYVKSVEKHIFISDYEENGLINRNDFMDNLSEDALFNFQDTLTEAFYEKNPEVYETAFALFEEASMEGKKDTVAVKFHEEYDNLYREFLLNVFDANF